VPSQKCNFDEIEGQRCIWTWLAFFQMKYDFTCMKFLLNSTFFPTQTIFQQDIVLAGVLRYKVVPEQALTYSKFFRTLLLIKYHPNSNPYQSHHRFVSTHNQVQDPILESYSTFGVCHAFCHFYHVTFVETK